MHYEKKLNTKIMTPVAKKVTLIITSIVVLLFALFIYFKFYYVFGEGVKTGNLNFVVYKGYIFKTYEGKIIQSGYRSKTTGTIQSYEFDFSIENKEVADSLMRSGGKEVELHYKEYLGTLPWRGMSKYIVDKILAVHD